MVSKLENHSESTRLSNEKESQGMPQVSGVAKAGNEEYIHVYINVYGIIIAPWMTVFRCCREGRKKAIDERIRK